MLKSINPKFIKEFIGYSDLKTTMRYVKPLSKDLKECSFAKLTADISNVRVTP